MSFSDKEKVGSKQDTFLRTVHWLLVGAIHRSHVLYQLTTLAFGDTSDLPSWLNFAIHRHTLSAMAAVSFLVPRQVLFLGRLQLAVPILKMTIDSAHSPGSV
eukprot:3084394-Amphidinium_carterae.1